MGHWFGFVLHILSAWTNTSTGVRMPECNIRQHFMRDCQTPKCQFIGDIFTADLECITWVWRSIRERHYCFIGQYQTDRFVWKYPLDMFMELRQQMVQKDH